MLTGRVLWPWYVGVSLTYWNPGEICGTYRTQHAEFSLGKTWYLSYGLYGWGRHASTADRHPPGLLLSILKSFHTNKARCSTVGPYDDRESVRPGPRMNEARDDVDTWTWREKGPTNRIIRVGYCARKSPFQITRLLGGQSLPTHGSTNITYLVRRISRISY